MIREHDVQDVPATVTCPTCSQRVMKGEGESMQCVECGDYYCIACLSHGAPRCIACYVEGKL